MRVVRLYHLINSVLISGGVISGRDMLHFDECMWVLSYDKGAYWIPGIIVGQLIESGRVEFCPDEAGYIATDKLKEAV